MATPQFKQPSTLEEAVAQLKRDPIHPVRLHVNDVDLEVRLLPADVPQPGLGDLFAEGGGWEGESADEILRFLREARKAGGSVPPPKGI